jgi:hypothetical protein
LTTVFPSGWTKRRASTVESAIRLNIDRLKRSGVSNSETIRPAAVDGQDAEFCFESVWGRIAAALAIGFISYLWLTLDAETANARIARRRSRPFSFG